MILIGQISKGKEIEHLFNAQYITANGSLQPEYVIAPSKTAFVITSEHSNKVLPLNYGLTPFWSSNKIVFNEAPVDGDVPSHPPKKEIQKRILQMPAFRKPIREQRCIIPVDYFICIENDRANLFYLNSGTPFAIAGVYDHWKLTIKDEILSSGFCPVTLPQVHFDSISTTRFPLMISPKHYKRWLNKETPLTEISELIKFYQSDELNGHSVSFDLINKGLNTERIVQPISESFSKHSIEERNFKSYLKNIRSRN